MKVHDSQRIELRQHPGVTPEMLASLGITSADVLDLSTGLNPYGPPQSLLDAAAAADLSDYPDPTAATARAGIAGQLRTDADCVVLGNGAAELLWTCARVLLSPGAAVLSIEPSYAEFTSAARQIGARIVQWRSVERTGHCVDLQQVGELMALEAPAVVSLCAPGTPTGSSVRFQELEQLAARFPETHFVVNQSWLSLSDDHADMERQPPRNVICVRSLSKDFALPGVRVGYLVAEAKLAARLEAARPAFTTSTAAQAVAIAAVEHGGFVIESRIRLHGDRTELTRALDQLGLAYSPSVVPFLLVRIARATEIAQELLHRHRIAVRDATPFGLPDHLRISACGSSGLSQLMAALNEIITRRGLLRGREA